MMNIKNIKLLSEHDGAQDIVLGIISFQSFHLQEFFPERKFMDTELLLMKYLALCWTTVGTERRSLTQQGKNALPTDPAARNN